MVDRAPIGNVLNFPTMPKKLSFLPLNRLRALRTAEGSSLATVAASCNTTAAQIQKLETGDRELDYGWMLRLGKHYEMPPADLLLEEDGGLTPLERHFIDTLREVPEAVREMLEGSFENAQKHRVKPEVINLEERKAS